VLAGAFHPAQAANYFMFDTDPDGGNSGRTVANFLLLPVGAQQLSLGTVPSMASWDATDALMATGNTAFFNQYMVAVTHLEWIMGLRKEFAAGCIPIIDIGTVGVYSQVFTIGSFENARDIDEYVVTNPLAAEVNVGASFAREIIPFKLGMGAWASYIESRLAGDDGRAFNAGFDATYRFSQKAQGRGYIRNLGSPIVYNETPEPLPLQIGLAGEYSPFIAEDTALGKSFSLSIGLGVAKTADLPIQAGLAVDVSPFREISLRAGYEYSYGRGPGLSGLSVGGGLLIKGYGADVAFKYQSPEFGWVWSATAKFATEEVKQRSAQEYYRIAEKHFRKERYNMCIDFAYRALKLNPDMWQAHELISKSVSRMRRAQGLEIGLVYTGNIQGQFAPLQIGQASMGGLARQATVIKTLIRQFPVCFVIDAGNFIKGTSHPFKAQFADSFYTMLSYDAAGIGPGEMDFGLERFLKGSEKSRKLFTLTNLANEYPGGAPAGVRFISAGKYTFALFDVIAPPLVSAEQARAQLVNGIPAVKRLLEMEKIKKCNLRIMILHAPWEAAKVYLQHLQGIDIVLMGSLEQKFDVPMKIGSTLFLSAGELGKYVGALTLRFDKKGKLLSYDNRLVPLIDAVAADAEMERAIEAIIARIDVAEQGLADRGLRTATPEGVFAFVSDRQGKNNVYLNVPMQKSQFPLTAAATRCASPRVSFKSEKIIYLEDNDSSRQTELFSMDLTGANKMRLPMPGNVSEACLSSNGDWAFVSVQTGRGSDIYRIMTRGGEPLPVVTWEDSDESNIDASPDSMLIAFASDRDGTWQIFFTDTSGSRPTQITSAKADHIRPRFSPDGKRLAYLSDKHGFGGKKDLWVHDVFEGGDAQVTAGVPVTDFCWLSDGKTIVCVAGFDTLRLFVCNIEKKERRTFIAPDSAGSFNEMSPRSVIIKGVEKVVYVREYENGERRIHWANTDGTDDRCIINSDGRDWIE